MSTQESSVVPGWPLVYRLRRAREFAGYDQTQMAEALGVSPNTVSNYERGFTRPRRPQLMAWALVTGVSFDWLEECAVRDSNPEPADSGPDTVAGPVA